MRIANNRSVLVATGLIVGLVVGINLRGRLPSVPLHASATDGLDNFAIATGLVDDSVEGLYFLDFITGDLKCVVVNPKTGKFNSLFSYNIAQDFVSRGGGNPKYLMVTGLANMPRGRAKFQFSQSIIYIAEATTGEVAAYTIPWSSSAQAAQQPQMGTFQPLDRVKIRTMTLRDQ